MEGEKEPIPPDDLRCKRSDGRGWRCKRAALAGKSLCDTHLHRASASSHKKKNLKKMENDVSTPDSITKPTPRVRIRLRLKPEPNDDTYHPQPVSDPAHTVGPAPSFAMLALPAVPISYYAGNARGVVEVAPNTAREAVTVARDEFDWMPVSAREVVTVARDEGTTAVMDTARDTVTVARDEGTTVMDTARDTVTVASAAVDGTPPEAVARAAVDDEETVLADEVRCSRNDGRAWRCKRQVVEGQTLCEIHISKFKIKSSVEGPAWRGPWVKRAAAVVFGSGGDGEEGGDFTPMRGPRVKRPGVVGNVEEGNVVPGLTSPRLKRPSFVGDPEEGSGSGMRVRPRVKRPAVVGVVEGMENGNGNGMVGVGVEGGVNGDALVGEVEERENGGVAAGVEDGVVPSRPLRVKRPSVVGDVDVRENGNGNGMVGGEDERMAELAAVQQPVRSIRVKRPAVVDDVEGRVNGNAVDGEDGVVRCSRDSGRGWRCGKVAKEGYTRCADHLNKGKDKGVENSEGKVKGKSKGKGKSKVKEVVDEEKFKVEEGLPDELRCVRNDGRDWRCKRRVVEGQTLCEAHFKRINLNDVRAKDVQKPVKKKRKYNKKVESKCELVVKEEVVSEKEEEEMGNQLEMVADLAVAEAEERGGKEGEGKGGKEGVVDLRCKRTDGRGWRCKRKVSDGKTLCEIHYEQGRLRQKRITVPESMKIQKGEGWDRVEKNLKRKRALEVLENNSGKGMKRMKAELIRVFLRREIIEQSKKSEKGDVNNSNSGEVTRDLPYGLMAIPPAPPAQTLEDAGSLGIKVGVHSSSTLVKRRFRSKNIEPPPVGAVKVVPYAGNVGKVKNGGKKKCHWCQNNDTSSLTKCLSCRKLFFCASCIKTRDTDPEEVKVKCPVCRESCYRKTCRTTQTKDETFKGTFKGSKFQQLQYLIKLLLPILEQINEEQAIETETEARFKGQDLSEVEIRQADVGCRDQCCCNNCKSPILDFHRSCPNCSYNLCLSCCREYSQGGCLRGTENSCSQPLYSIETQPPGLRNCSEKILKNSSAHRIGNTDVTAAATLSDSTPCLHISCPPMELGGCDNSLLDLRCIFPLNWTKELEVSAKETASGHEFLQTTDDSLHCSLCATIKQTADKTKEIQEASSRTQPHDNFVYCPSSSDDHYDVLAHFQKHWRKGHPVKVRNVLQCASPLSWDPLAMFCSCLEDNSTKCVDGKDAIGASSSTDWYEVELGTKESFTQSVAEGYSHRRHKTLRVKAKLPSTFSQTLLEDRYSEIIRALPLQEYTNPRSGLLNIAGKLPEDFPESKLGPHVFISFGSRDVVARGELVTKLHSNSFDVVNILAHVTDATCSTEQLNKISMLLRRNDMKDKEKESSQNLENETRMHRENSGEVGGQDPSAEDTALGHGVGPCCSPTTNDISAVNLPDSKSSAKLQSSDTDSDASVICSGTSDSPYKSLDEMAHLERLESSRLADARPLEPCGAQWDVFRRQDVPKLLEYITKHVDELSLSCDFPKNVVHPIFDGSFYLNSIHKMQLKEEFDIEPWTFNQCLGEAVFIPAGCPYQMRNVKSCVNVALGFISPENASECIKLINEIRVLPNNHKAKEVKLEVEKMTICSVDEAIKEIYRLRSEESNHLDQEVQIPIANS